MNTDTTGIEVTRERIEVLRQHEEEIVTDPSKPVRMKELELAGVRAMVAQLEGEVREEICLRLRQQIGTLRLELDAGDPEAVDRVVRGTLDVVEQLTLQNA